MGKHIWITTINGMYRVLNCPASNKNSSLKMKDWCEKYFLSHIDIWHAKMFLYVIKNLFATLNCTTCNKKFVSKIPRLFSTLTFVPKKIIVATYYLSVTISVNLPHKWIKII